MKTQNKAQLIGYLGADPKIVQTPSGNQYATMRLATDQIIKTNKASTTKITTWHTIKVWGKSRMASLQNNFMKGSHVLVEGSIDYYTVRDKSGATQYRTELKAHHLMNLDR